jgi:hypothetical protein
MVGSSKKGDVRHRKYMEQVQLKVVDELTHPAVLRRTDVRYRVLSIVEC